MRVIVSTELEDSFDKYVIVKSLEEVKQLSDVECIIIHSYSDLEVSLGSQIADLHTKFNCLFFYINARPKAVVTLLINGVSGICMDDEFYFEDEEELDGLLEVYGFEETSLVVSDTRNNLAIVKEFMGAYVRGEECCKLQYYISQVNTALAELEATNEKRELQLQEMGSSAIEVFNRASEYINKIEENSRSMAQQLSELTKQTNTPRNRFGSGGGIAFYPTVQFNCPSTKKMLVIREFSPCRYLTSFVLSYANYLKIIKHKRVRLIFTVQRGNLIRQKYVSELFTFIGQEAVGKTDLYDRETLVTSVPQKQVLLGMLEAGTTDVIILVDRMFSGDVILKGTGIKQVNAVSGSTDLTRFKLNPRNCIFSHITYPNELLHIPTISKYPPASAVDTRVAAYAQACNSLGLYNAMDNFIELNARR